MVLAVEYHLIGNAGLMPFLAKHSMLDSLLNHVAVLGGGPYDRQRSPLPVCEAKRELVPRTSDGPPRLRTCSAGPKLQKLS
eukprot:9404802-Alexandrium_andersonii.AAC.1